MRMATLKSQQNNPWFKFGIVSKHIKKTKKLFYGKYLFQVSLKIPGIYLYREVKNYGSRKSFVEYVDNKKQYVSQNNYWTLRHLKDADPKQIFATWQKLKDFEDRIKVRVEASKISICADSEETLREVLTSLKSIKAETVSLFLPANEEEAEKMKDGILFVSDPKLKFRAMIRSRRYDETVRTQIHNYVENYEGTILMSPNLKYKLTNSGNSNDYISGYFYVDNMECLMFLQLICPTFVGKIFPLESHTINN